MPPPASPHSSWRSKKKHPPKAGAPKHLSGVWPCFHLVRRFSSQANHLYSTSTATGVSRRLIACPQTASRTLRRSLLEEHLSSLDFSKALIRPRILVQNPIETHLQHAQSLGELVLDGLHKPFRALACPLNKAGLRAEEETQHHK